MNMMKKINSPYGYLSSSSEAGIKSFWLYGTIGIDINVEYLIGDLNNTPPGIHTLEFYMHSPGGLVYEGYSLLTAIRRINKKYNTIGYIDGIAASMMSAIAVTFDKLYVSETSKMMIHDPMIGIDLWGYYNRKDLSDMKEMIEELESSLTGDANILAKVYAHKVGRTPQEVMESWLDDGKDHHFTPDEMISEGLADEIVDKYPDLPVNIEDVEQNQWEMFANKAMSDLQMAAIASEIPLIYRGAQENKFKKFSITKNFNKLLKVVKADDQLNNEINLYTMNIFANLSKRFGIEEGTIKTLLESYESAVATELNTARAELGELNDLVAEYKKAEETNIGIIAELKNEVRISKVAGVISEIKEDATKGKPRSVVNTNIDEKLNTLTVEYLQASDEDPESTRAVHIREHMELLAKNNLVPIGSDPRLTDNGKPSGKNPVDQSADLDEAKKIGERIAAKNKSKWAGAQKH